MAEEEFIKMKHNVREGISDISWMIKSSNGKEIYVLGRRLMLTNKLKEWARGI